MGRKSLGSALLTMGALLSSTSSSVNAEGGGLRRKRSSSSHQYKSSRQSHQQQQHQRASSEQQDQQQRHLPGGSNNSNRNLAAEETSTTAAAAANTEEDLADPRRFFLPPSHQELDDIDMRQLILEMNLDSSMSIITEQPTRAPTNRPTVSPTYSTMSPSTSSAPTLTDCDNPGTCENRLRQQIYDVSVRVGTVETLDDPNSAQSKASEWILEECGAFPPIDPCTESQIILNEQRYALAVMYFSLSGEGWNDGSNPSVDKGAGEGVWLSGLNYCDWGVQITGDKGDYVTLVCDEFGNVLNLNLQSNNMVGQIPPEIGVLVYLTSYISFFNAQSGPIPTSLGLITPLQTFDVESNNMDGSLFQPQYSGPDGLTEVVNFRASLNNFRGNIPTEIGRWTKLQNLWFADNEITGTIPSEVGNLVDMSESVLLL
ncbi:hypothetical protein ACHAXR_003808 [Thalassiosira sp. AJA248-18]